MNTYKTETGGDKQSTVTPFQFICPICTQYPAMEVRSHEFHKPVINLKAMNLKSAQKDRVILNFQNLNLLNVTLNSQTYRQI